MEKSKVHDYRIVGNLDIHSPEAQKLVQQGRAEIFMAEKEMPGLMALRDEFKSERP